MSDNYPSPQMYLSAAIFTLAFLVTFLVLKVKIMAAMVPAAPVYVCREHNTYLVADGVVVNLERSCKIIAEGTLQ